MLPLTLPLSLFTWRNQATRVSTKNTYFTISEYSFIVLRFNFKGMLFYRLAAQLSQIPFSRWWLRKVMEKFP